MGEGRTHKPVIRADQCQRCEVCLSGCPAEIVPEYRRESTSLRGTLYGAKIQDGARKSSSVFPPCQESCPVHQDTRGYTALIAQGKFAEALALIRETNPLPSVCGFICHHPCEEACLRGTLDHPIPLRLFKRFVAQGEMKEAGTRKIRIKIRKGKILIIGSGPAGLAAAHDLSLLGYRVTIWEALPIFGGMLTVGIPEFRLPRSIISAEVKRIHSLGTEMITNHVFHPNGKGWTSVKRGYDATFVAVGAHRSARLHLPGEGRNGVLYGVEFLRTANLGRKMEAGGRIAVIGGGNVAIDAARTALRLGAETVDMYYRRSRKEMPGIPEEVDEAQREGIQVHLLAAPVQIIRKNGRVTGMECVRTQLTGPDETGRRQPVPIPGSSFRVRADQIIAAVGQRTDRKTLRGLDLNEDGTVQVDPGTGETSLKGIFAGGDVVTGPGWAIDAIAAGKKAAQSIHRYLS